MVFGDEVLAIAVLGRFLHRCDVVCVHGSGYRLPAQEAS
ncbi:ATP-binding protein [Streptomyces sp. NPDC088785]